uniref:Uncharacterized protein n=2 Tax=Picea TaxID=3328 RepID=A0A101M158_PICGL|nr:hypothetical protein ABT39_MTgene3685 [Picea glauca]QHR90331.1 hypothetical protein Q903MT_gene4354 [Picea sitchensis]
MSLWPLPLLLLKLHLPLYLEDMNLDIKRAMT